MGRPIDDITYQKIFSFLAVSGAVVFILLGWPFNLGTWDPFSDFPKTPLHLELVDWALIIFLACLSVFILLSLIQISKIPSTLVGFGAVVSLVAMKFLGLIVLVIWGIWGILILGSMVVFNSKK